MVLVVGRVMLLLLFCNELLASRQSAPRDRITLCYDHWPSATIHASVREPRHGFIVEDEQVARYLLRRQGLENQVKQVGAFPVSLALYPGFSSRYPGVGKLVALWDLAMQPSQISGRLIQRMADY